MQTFLAPSCFVLFLAYLSHLSDSGDQTNCTNYTLLGTEKDKHRYKAQCAQCSEKLIKDIKTILGLEAPDKAERQTETEIKCFFTTFAGSLWPGRYFTFSWSVLIISVSLRPFTVSSNTHIFTVLSNFAFCAALAPTILAMAEPLYC